MRCVISAGAAEVFMDLDTDPTRAGVTLSRLFNQFENFGLTGMPISVSIDKFKIQLTVQPGGDMEAFAAMVVTGAMI